MPTRPSVLIAVAVCLATQPAFCAEDPGLAESLRPVIAAHEGTVTVAVTHLGTGASYSYHADEPMPTASLIKFPVMVAAYQLSADGKIDLASPIELEENDKVPGSGILTPHFSAGLRISLRDAIRLMIVYSDNTATNLVLDEIGLPTTSELMSRWEFPNTRLHSKVFRADSSVEPDRSRKFGLGSTTAQEMVRLLTQLHRKELVSAEASQKMYEHLLACEDKSRLARLLPKDTRVALKTGSVNASRTVAGILETPAGHIAICILTTNNKDQRWTDDNAAVMLSSEIARRVYLHFNPSTNPETPASPKVLVEGASGELVEAVQRTLNRRHGAHLSVDGDFGPMTKNAVIAFQKSRNLAATGTVNDDTWKAIGPLILSEDEIQIDPDVINKQQLPLAPADPITGPPFVTARSWAIGDPLTGQVLWNDKGDERREIASTTKIMTAWLILRAASEDPGLLEAVITFSNSADQTSGSTAGLRAGEKTSVKELLYGLLLPSGNDAATALAEFTGPRFMPDPENPDGNLPVARFVAEMNRTAAELGMKHTHYSNPHGLPDSQHLSTANDQILLARRVMQDKLFRQYMRTRQHAVQVEGPGGYTRNVLWKNTNRLLDIAGYSGLKTGSTGPAGSCLVSVGSQGNDELIVVVLGSSSDEARYLDTRNLFRWGWQQRR